MLAYQRDSLISELQQLQEAKPILAQAYTVSNKKKLFIRLLESPLFTFSAYSTSESVQSHPVFGTKEQTLAKCPETTAAVHGNGHAS